MRINHTFRPSPVGSPPRCIEGLSRDRGGISGISCGRPADDPIHVVFVSDRHAFVPSRPGGTVCVAPREHRGSTELCGYPAGHGIHSNTPAEARAGISDTIGAALSDLAQLRREILEYGDERAVWAQGKAAGSGALQRLRDGMYSRLDRIEAALRRG